MDTSKNDFIIVAYYTNTRPYIEHVNALVLSLIHFNLKYYIYEADDQGSWVSNCSYKPTFIRSMMDKFPNKSIVYTDIDSIFIREPHLFSEIACDIACHHFNRQQYKPRSSAKDEILSGTIFFNNSDTSKEIVDEWITECNNNPESWDQSCLQSILRGREEDLPPEYCCIFDTMKSITNPVILHKQASRQAKKLERKRR